MRHVEGCEMRIIVAVCSAWTIGLVLGVAHAEEMPPLPEARQAIYDKLSLEFLPDGYPGKQTEHGVAPHPIYGPSVINLDPGLDIGLDRWRGRGRWTITERAR